MTTPDRTLGVAVCGTGWCAVQHISAFQKNPRARVTWICGRDVERARAALSKAGVAVDGVRLTRDYGELLAARDVDIISIATPNHLHADEAVGAARAGKHFVLEKPTGLDVPELVRVRDAVRKAGVRTHSQPLYQSVTFDRYCVRAKRIRPSHPSARSHRANFRNGL